MGRERIIQVRRDTAANWAARNPVLLKGEPGFAVDTGVFRLGDGVTPWNGLSSTGSGAVEHVWATQGVAGWTPANINPGTTGDTTPCTMSVSASKLRGRVTRAVADSNEREMFLHDGTNWADSEVRSTIYGPDAATWGAPNAGVQLGHVHRAQLMNDGVNYRGVIVNQNVIFSGFYIWNIGVWNGTRTNGTSKIAAGPSFQPQVLGQQSIIAVERYSNAGTWTDRFYLDSIGNIQVGDIVSAYGLATTAFNRTELTVTLVQPGPIGSAAMLGKGVAIVECTKSGTTAAVVARTADLGTIQPAAIGGTVLSTKFANPVHLATRVIGTNLWAKAWRADQGEPDWDDPWSSSYYDFSGALVDGATPIETPTGIGRCGIVANHLGSGATGVFGDVSMKAL